jgi:uncharacterized protein DUF955
MMIDLLKNIKYDNNFLPIISEAKMEYIVLDILYKYSPSIAQECKMVPIVKIIERLSKEHELKLDAKKLPPGDLGHYDYASNTICIDSATLPPDCQTGNLWRFTLAHELGHFFLHSIPGLILMEDSTKMFRIFNKPDKPNITDWAEWQANVFASSFLVPKFAFRKLVKSFFKENRIYKKYLWVDHQEVNQKTYREIICLISDKFQVSKQVAQIRLEKFNYVKYDDKCRPNSIINVADFL